MADIKRVRLPDRTPVKLTISIMPDLHQALLDYASVYAEAYGSQEQVSALIPAMLTSFIESDRAFLRARGRPS